VNDKRPSAWALMSIGRVLRHQDELTGSRKSYEEALALFEEFDVEGSLGPVHLGLAALSLEEARPEEAEVHAREAAEQLALIDQLPDLHEAMAWSVLSLALLAQGKLDAARDASDQAASLAEQSRQDFVRLSVAITAARVRAALDRGAKTSEAFGSLEAVLAEATADGYADLQLEARLALGELELASGKSAAGRARIQALETEAAAKGFRLVARKASAARK
jgi:tetratricopeptide (TPR) repeat protein